MKTSEKCFYVPVKNLKEFCTGVFESLGMGRKNSETTADVLVTADMRGIPSHGVGRLQRYVNGLRTGQMKPEDLSEIIRDTAVSTVINAHGMMGPPVSVKAMEMTIGKAEKNGAAFCCVHDSNHFGIAGYYAMKALKHDMIGIAMTNTAALGVPTFGRQVMFGTNPFAFCAPALEEGAFVLDMSTTVVSRGKIEVYERESKKLPDNWAVDKTGRSTNDAGKILDDMFHRYGGGILPLGGFGEQYGGYKGYGMAVMVDILCAVLCGSSFGPDISDTATSSARVSHFFGAIKIDKFREPEAFRHDMDRMLRQLENTPPAEGEERVYFAGQKEMEHEKDALRNGIPLSQATFNNLSKISEEFKIDFSL